MSDTSIEWTDKTWNPTRGCSRVSAGCDHCYAMREAHRHDHPGGSYEGLTRVGSRGVDWNGKVRLVPEQLDAPLRWRKPQRIFVNSMSDLFHESLPPAAILAVFTTMARARRHTFQVLTKRPERMRDLLSAWVRDGLTLREGHGVALPNVWLGVSVEDQATADERIPLLLQTPAAVRFVSYEPALGPVDFDGDAYDGPGWLRGYHAEPVHACGGSGDDPEACGRLCPEPEQTQNERLDWVIVGGESGPGSRPLDVAWARSTVAHCRNAGVPVFVKQLGAKPETGDCGMAHGECHHPLKLKDRKGGDPSEWPEDLRVREFPR